MWASLVNIMSKSDKRASTRRKAKGIKKNVADYKKRVRIVSTLVASIIVFSLIFAGSYYLLSTSIGGNPSTNQPQDLQQNQLDDNLPNAALIDALYSTSPNLTFTASLGNTLQDVGFDVDVYQGGEVTVDFLKKFPCGYELVILRMHSALSNSNELYLFTAEPYSAGKYVQEQYFRLVKEAYPTEESQSVFAVNWGFVERLMTEKFKGALVIVMGCDGANDPWMAKEFINRGAVGYVGWNGSVLLSHSDRAVSCLIQALYVDKLSLEDAVKRTNSQIGEDPQWGSMLNYSIR
jgi:hypothetical protein